MADARKVGAHEFRNLFDWSMQRAHAGERFLVTHRGKPYVRLVPASERLWVQPGREPLRTKS
ncbi:MAG TPA: type II toxin-antitoxin system prevent-host-death family antitoxin [Solirubrobacterales bacterium]|nr:type II toxin-antitoxin system prevent-host-death family antitoxin [Solirubrobacterales bacterium]